MWLILPGQWIQCGGDRLDCQDQDWLDVREGKECKGMSALAGGSYQRGWLSLWSGGKYFYFYFEF